MLGRGGKKILIALGCVGIAAAPEISGAWKAAVDGIKITRHARSLRPGEVVLIEARSARPLRRLRATVFGHDFPVFSDGDRLKWTSLVGIDLDTRPGRYVLKLAGEDNGGNPIAGQNAFAVASRTFPTRQLTVDEKFVTPPQDALARIRKEAELVRTIFDSITPRRYWEGPFIAPVPGPPISEFGKRSVYNGQSRSPHSGTDFRGAAGTPIRAPNAGRIVLASDLYYSGNTVIIDHGFGLYSYFGHMSSFAVNEGAQVKTGEVVGRVGATGLVTGPHLHWSVRLAGSRVDPLSLLSVLGAGSQ